ncbi:MAG: ChbG/HpnK family deacetylase, partial [Anaerolineaceae bacterium]
MKYLIVNADDYGHTAGVSAGIRMAHLKGIVTSTSAMMNSPHIEVELPRLIELCPQIGIGVHLVMTSGKPILPAGSLPVLMSLSEDGQSFKHDPLGDMERIDTGEVCAEWQAQIDKFIRIAGRIPDHLDAHHHAMCFSENLFQIYLELASGIGCPVRRALEDFMVGSVLFKEEQKLSEVKMPDWFDGRFYDDQATNAMLDRMIVDLQPGVTEWMCHPAEVDQEIMHKSSYNTRRGEELKILVQPGLQQRLERSGVKLVPFGFINEKDES